MHGTTVKIMKIVAENESMEPSCSGTGSLNLPFRICCVSPPLLSVRQREYIFMYISVSKSCKSFPSYLAALISYITIALLKMF
jgi:hypothetical protein